jgi:hypothetical protein
MARKLKTYQTSLGFFDLAVAEPSMKGCRQQSLSPGRNKARIRTSSRQPWLRRGVVLKRPVGSSGPFKEHAAYRSSPATTFRRRRPAGR